MLGARHCCFFLLEFGCSASAWGLGSRCHTPLSLSFSLSSSLFFLLAAEKEVTLECMRKLMNVKPLHNTRSLQSTRSGLTQAACEGEPMQIRSRIVASEFKSGDRPDPYAGTPPCEALKVQISVAANHKQTFSVVHIDVSRAYFHAMAHSAGGNGSGGQNGRRYWQNWSAEKEYVWHTGRSKQLGA